MLMEISPLNINNIGYIPDTNIIIYHSYDKNTKMIMLVPLIQNNVIYNDREKSKIIKALSPYFFKENDKGRGFT